MPSGVYVRTEEHNRKLSEALKKRHINGEKFGFQLGDGNIAKRPEIRKKNREAKINLYKEKGNVIGFQKGNKLFLGEKHTKETKEKIGKAQRGELGNNWQGGISYQPYPLDWTDDLRESIRKRDGYVCQECGIHQDELNNWHKKLDVHHIDYCKDNLNPKNLITLCRRCNSKANFNKDYWTKHFNNL